VLFAGHPFRNISIIEGFQMNVLSIISLDTNKNGRNFSFFIPVGASYDEASEVLTEMSLEVASMKEEMLKQKATQESETAVEASEQIAQ
jgi:hypothetical protein